MLEWSEKQLRSMASIMQLRASCRRNLAFQNAELLRRMEVTVDPHNSFMRPVIGRLKPGVSPAQAQAELQTFAARLPLDRNQRRDEVVAEIVPLRELFAADVRKLLLIFAGAVLFVFLIACGNFANLLLIRGTSRQQEIAIRAALGAGRRRLVQQLLVESTLLSLFGGAAGVLLSVGGVRALLAILPAGEIPHVRNVHIDGWVLTFTFGLSLLTGIVFGLAPALRITVQELREATNDGGRQTTTSHERLRGVFVIAEIALALVLLSGAGLLVRSFLRIRSVNPGFRSANILAATVDLPASRYRSARQMQALIERVRIALALLPGTESVGSVNWIPLRPEFARGDFQLEDGRRLPSGFLVDKPVVSIGYFRTMGIRLLTGRDFTERDNASAPAVVIISESVARRLWPAGDATGKRISMEDHPKPGDWLTIVGIVNDVKQQSLTDTPSASIYQPYMQVSQPFFLSHVSFVVQTKRNPAALASGVRTVLHKADDALPAQSVTTMDSIIADTITEARAQTRLLSMFSMIALFLAAIGIYGVLVCSVVERTHEIGIRVAIGAQAADVLEMVFYRTLVLAGSGVAVGTAIAFMLTRILSKFLFEVTPTDPFTFIAVTGLLLFVAFAATWIPARRAILVDPMDALRYE